MWQWGNTGPSLFYPFSNTVQTLRSTHNRKRPQNKKKAPAIAYIF